MGRSMAVARQVFKCRKGAENLHARIFALSDLQFQSKRETERKNHESRDSAKTSDN